MSMQPDFKNYSLYELLDAERTINSELYPERASEIKELIAEKRNNPQAQRQIIQEVADIKYSTFWPRFWAGFVDGIVLSLAFLTLSYLFFSENRVNLLAVDNIEFFISLAFSISLHALFGQTVGKMLLNIKVVDNISEGSINLKQAIFRDIVPILLFIVSLISYLSLSLEVGDSVPMWYFRLAQVVGSATLIWYIAELVTMLFNSKNRALHDLIAGTVVIRT